MRKSELIVLAMIVSSFIIGVCFYPRMPEAMASHWNAKGEVDGYMPRVWGLFLMPSVSLGLLLLFAAIPKIDPLRANIRKFIRYYDLLVVLVIAFLFYLYLLTILWNVGLRFEMNQFLAPALGLLFFYCGILIENAKRNWFIGIRTPWTLSSERVWEKTHRIGGRLFKIAGLVALVGTFFPDYAMLFVLIPILAVAVYTIVYSYLEYQKETQ